MIVFYSWQSWLSTNVNRNFIHTAIQKAMDKVVKDEPFLKLDALLEKDTENVTGSPDIVDTIFAKIRECDVFIGDVTPVVTDENGNKIPNPNVLVELGYAASEIGWERVICVLNTAFGNIEDLPFDIRQYRITTYRLEEGMSEEERSKQRAALVGAIVASLKSIESRSSPDVDYMNRLIRRPLYPIRIGTPVILWSFDLVQQDTKEEQFVYHLLQRLVNDAGQAAREDLPMLLVEKSHALTSRQKKRCREIAKVTEEIAIRVGFVLSDWEMRRRQSVELNIQMQYSLHDYMASAIGVLKRLYETKWLTLFDNLDNMHVPGPDEYLFGKKPLSAEKEQQIQDKLYELEGWKYQSREEFDKAFDPTPTSDMEFDVYEMLARATIESTYKDKELVKAVWSLISYLKAL